MFGVLVFTAGVLLSGPALAGTRAQRVRRSLEDECYNVGSCTPAEEPNGGEQEICRIFEESLTCMQRAMEACRQLDFPPDTVHLASDGLHFLREKLHNHCSKRLGNLKTGGGGGGGGSRDGGREQPSIYLEHEMSAHSEQNVADINRGNGLPSPIFTVLVTSLVLAAAMSDMWTNLL
ncbi:hypothetical protein ACOMHN_000594 [Nucella lapillus]